MTDAERPDISRAAPRWFGRPAAELDEHESRALRRAAALQAPVIMMSQNRQAAKDRLDAAHDYEVNLKSEIEIMALHDKLDQLRTQDLEAMLRKQQEQIDLLTRLVESRGGSSA